MISLSDIQPFISRVLDHQVTQFGAAFTLAAWLHGNQVKGEIRSQFTDLTKAINDVAAALRQDLTKQSERIGNVEKTVDKIDNRVSKLEGDK